MIEINNTKKAFTFTRVYTPHDPALYQQSSGALIIIKRSNDFKIIPVHAIQSIVAAIPWEQHGVGAFFIMEKPGLPSLMLEEYSYNDKY